MTTRNFSAKSTRICGHTDMTSFTYGSTASRTSERLYFANTLCMACTKKLTELAAPEAKGFFELDLPKLVGVGKSPSYANIFRIKALRSIGPVMDKLNKSDEPYSKVALAVYVMLFKITEASFWIAGKESAYERSWLTFEVAALMRRGLTASVRTERSALEYWLSRDLSVIDIARQSLDALEYQTEQSRPAPALSLKCGDDNSLHS